MNKILINGSGSSGNNLIIDSNDMEYKNGIECLPYENSCDASVSTGVCQRNILQVANKEPYNKNGKIRKQAGGFIWKFAIE